MSENFKRGFKSWCENASLQIRRELDLTPEEPLNACNLAKHLKILVWQAHEVPGVSKESLRVLLEEDSRSWSAVSMIIDSQHLIILNPKHSKSRQSNTIAHEVSHILLDHNPARIDVSEQGLLLNTYNKMQEREADWFAGALLLPRDALVLIRRAYKNLGHAARQYGVSSSLLQYRMNITGVNYQYRKARKST